jgi:hypothetical protein
MANGTRQGAHGRTRRNGLPRIHSPEGVAARFQIRRGHAPVTTTDRFRGGFRVPGSRNVNKVGRG